MGSRTRFDVSRQDYGFYLSKGTLIEGDWQFDWGEPIDEEAARALLNTLKEALGDDEEPKCGVDGYVCPRCV